jgi:hypothetical protein
MRTLLSHSQIDLYGVSWLKGVNASESMTSMTNCLICGQPLVYSTEARIMKCDFCGYEDNTLIYCAAGHYVCDLCHCKKAIEVTRQLLYKIDSKDPVYILEHIMAHPAISMHGPEHHAIVPGAIIAAVRNAGYRYPDGAINEALERAIEVPGGWCGSCGTCGAAVGVGIAVSVLTDATPLTGQPRLMALGATSFALARMLDGQPRCCKRATRLAVAAAVDYLREHLEIQLPRTRKTICTYVTRNQECPRTLCPYYDYDTELSRT